MYPCRGSWSEAENERTNMQQTRVSVNRNVNNDNDTHFPEATRDFSELD